MWRKRRQRLRRRSSRRPSKSARQSSPRRLVLNSTSSKISSRGRKLKQRVPTILKERVHMHDGDPDKAEKVRKLEAEAAELDETIRTARKRLQELKKGLEAAKREVDWVEERIGPVEDGEK